MMILSFQSTPSAWRETHTPPKLHQLPHISIHSLRMEGDRKAADPRLPGCAISIHSLRMEGDTVPIFEGLRHNISIHSLRMEGDIISSSSRMILVHFNPLPPHGGRHNLILISHDFGPFQSTPSAWRETWPPHMCRVVLPYFNPLPPHGGRRISAYLITFTNNISIHSLRMEGD